jgi:hypothetical protein
VIGLIFVQNTVIQKLITVLPLGNCAFVRGTRAIRIPCPVIGSGLDHAAHWTRYLRPSHIHAATNSEIFWPLAGSSSLEIASQRMFVVEAKLVPGLNTKGRYREQNVWREEAHASSPRHRHGRDPVDTVGR